MFLFVAIFRDPLSDEVMKLAKSGPVEVSYRLDDHALVMRSDVANPQVLGNHFGLNGDSPPPRLGIVFRLNESYYGYHEQRLWDWLKEHRS